MRLDAVEKARLVSNPGGPVENLDLDGLLAKIVGGPPNPTQREFILCPDKRALFRGPIGSAKSTSLLASLLLPALMYPGTRFGLFRSDWWTLVETTLQDLIDIISERFGWQLVVRKLEGPPYRMWIHPARPDATGRYVPSEIFCHGLDDLGKLGSTRFTGVYIDEVSEVDEKIAITLSNRLRHRRPLLQGEAPDPQGRPKGPFFWRACTNPTRRSHWVHKKFCGQIECGHEDEDCEHPSWGTCFVPQPRENEHNLPANYYDEESQGMSPEMFMRMIMGNCGPDPSGQGVFSSEFRMETHVGNLKAVKGVPGIGGWDFGRRRPAFVAAQRLPNSCMNYLLAELGHNENLQTFATRVLQMRTMRFPEITEWMEYVDPHGTQKKDTAEKSSIDVLQQDFKLKVRYRDTLVENGIELMSKGLNTLINGRPRNMFDRNGCRILIEGYMGGYVYNTPRAGHQEKPTPLKDGFYEHPMDANRYIEVGVNMGSTVPAGKHKKNLRTVRNRLTGY